MPLHQLKDIDGKGGDIERQAIVQLRLSLGPNYVDALWHLYRSSRSNGVRAACIYYCFEQARTNQAATELAVLALGDRSKIVRYRACQLLAYSLDRVLLPRLDAIRKGIPKDSLADLDAAIDAIANQNQNYFLDRTHTGNIFMEHRTQAV